MVIVSPSVGFPPSATSFASKSHQGTPIGAQTKSPYDAYLETNPDVAIEHHADQGDIPERSSRQKRRYSNLSPTVAGEKHTPTSGDNTSKNTKNQQVYSPSDPDHSPMHHDTSQPNSKRSKRAEIPQPNHAVTSGLGTYLMASDGFMMEFPGGILENKTLNTIFDEVSTLTSEHLLQKIEFKLEKTAKKEKKKEETSKKWKKWKNVRSSVIKRDTEGLFELMIQEFGECVEQLERAGKTKQRVVLISKAEHQGAENSEIDEDELYTSD